MKGKYRAAVPNFFLLAYFNHLSDAKQKAHKVPIEPSQVLKQKKVISMAVLSQ